jgi:hypothetical protein
MKNTDMRFPLILVLGLMAFACGANQPDSSKPVSSSNKILPKNNARVIHVFVALCDNVNQGIVKVPAAIGNGQDAAGNLYWGAAYGVKSYFKKQSDWVLLKSGKHSKEILDRCVFKHKTANVYLVADAYDGALIKKATVNFLKSCAGSYPDSVLLKEEKLYIGGSSNLLSFIGHDGLMDFDLDEKFKRADTLKRESIILACIGKRYFTPHIKTTGAIPLLWSTGLMSPEAYTLKAAIDGWIKNESAEQVRTRAAAAYHQYQKCGIKGARNLLVTGF